MCIGLHKTPNKALSCLVLPCLHVSLGICFSWVREPISLVECVSSLVTYNITSGVCYAGKGKHITRNYSRVGKTHFTRDMCAGEHISWGDTYHCDVTLICGTP